MNSVQSGTAILPPNHAGRTRLRKCADSDTGSPATGRTQSFERRSYQTRRIQRFAVVLETRTGQGTVPLAAESLAQLQEAILGKTTTLPACGLRLSPVYVGQTVRYENVEHYVAPPWDAVPQMVDALREFLRRTAGASSVMRAAVASFGFVYIYPWPTETDACTVF